MLLPYSITVVSCIRLRSLIGFAQAYPQNPTSKHTRIHLELTCARLRRLTRPPNSGLLRRSTMVSPRADHRRDSHLPPGDKAGGRQVRAGPAGDHLAVHVPTHQWPVVHCDGGQVSRGQERTRQVHHYQVLGHYVEGPHAAEDTDRGQKHHDESVASCAPAKTTAHVAQPWGGGRHHAALFSRHDAVVAWGRGVLPQCLRRAGRGLGKRGCLRRGE